MSVYGSPIRGIWRSQITKTTIDRGGKSAVQIRSKHTFREREMTEKTREEQG